MSEFSMTREGCKLAKEWLERNNRLHEIEKEQSVDGYTLVRLANQLIERQTEDLGSEG